MTKIIVADTGPLIALAQVGLLSALPELFKQAYVTPGVVEEATKDSSKPGARAIVNALDNSWITPHEIELSGTYLSLLDLLDEGESQTLALAQVLEGTALIDERKGRAVAKKLGISYTGTAAVLIKAKQAGVISDVKPLILTLREQGYRLSDRLIAEILHRTGES